MKLHDKLEYKDLERVENKIILTEDMVKRVYQAFVLYSGSFFLNYDFDTLNIELWFDNKINIYVENEDEDHAMITVFHNEKKLVSFEIDHMLDSNFAILYIFEYLEIDNYSNTVEEIILFSLTWFVRVLFYKQWHTVVEEQKNNSTTFFVNTKNTKLEYNKKSR